MTFTDVPAVFECGGDALVGVISQPLVPLPLGLVIVVGGPQYRVGSHRQFLLLAHAAASAGYAVLRFDCRGMGDSEGDPRGFENLLDDIGAAVDFIVSTCPPVKRVVLWGLCDGASSSLLYVGSSKDERIAGLCLLNPWVRSQASLAKATMKHYYVVRIVQGDFWRKLFKGELKLRSALKSLLKNIRESMETAPALASRMPFQKRMAFALRGFNGATLCILAECDLTAKEFQDHIAGDSDWMLAMRNVNFQTLNIHGADHTFSSSEWRSKVERATLTWLAEI